jgi:hypothetical protein
VGVSVIAYRDKKVVGIFVRFSCAASPAAAGFLDYFDWRTLVNVYRFVCSIFLRCCSQIDKKPIMNPKIGEPVMQSLTEGIKFVFNNKVLGYYLIW